MAKKQLDEDLLVSGGASSAQHSKSAKAAAAKQKRAAKAKARYDKKKEAILVFGLSLWGASIPKLKGFLGHTDEEAEYWEDSYGYGCMEESVR